jgi:hypothetical protein
MQLRVSALLKPGRVNSGSLSLLAGIVRPIVPRATDQRQCTRCRTPRIHSYRRIPQTVPTISTTNRKTASLISERRQSNLVRGARDCHDNQASADAGHSGDSVNG